jgi:serine/threonine-protein kinase
MISRRTLLSAAIVALPASAAAQKASAQEVWATYRNDRFGTTIEYPTRFRPGRPPENNDGLSFVAADGAKLSVWGSFNAMEHDVAGLEQFLRESRDAGEHITYRAAGKNWLILSGTRGERVFHRRHVFSHRNEIVNAFEISYPSGRATSYDPIVARISKSLRSGRGYQTP